MVAELFVTEDREFQTAGAVILNALDWKPWSLSPADRVVVDWRISEYELVDDNEASMCMDWVTLNNASDYFTGGLYWTPNPNPSLFVR